MSACTASDWFTPSMAAFCRSIDTTRRLRPDCRLSSTSTMSGWRVERLAHDAREFLSHLVERAVDLRHQRRLHRRAGRHLDDLHGRAVSQPDLRQRRSRRNRDLVALAVAVVLVDQVHLDVAELRAGAQVVLPHEPVEVDRRRRARVDLVVRHLRQLRDRRPQARRARAPSPRAPCPPACPPPPGTPTCCRRAASS